MAMFIWLHELNLKEKFKPLLVTVANSTLQNIPWELEKDFESEIL